MSRIAVLQEVSGFPVNDFSVANCESYFGEGSDALRGICGKRHEVGIKSFGDAPGVRGIAESFRGIGGERGQDLLPGEAGEGHQREFFGGIELVGIAKIGAEENLTARIGVGLQLLGRDAKRGGFNLDDGPTAAMRPS